MTSIATSACKRVLLVDDNVDALSLMHLLLTSLGFNVEMANNGREGLRLAETFLPQVVFLDLGMPEMSGYDVAIALRKMPSLEGLLLIALTGWNDEKTRSAVFAAGFDHHLVKPSKLEEILSILNEHFEVRYSAQ